MRLGGYSCLLVLSHTRALSPSATRQVWARRLVPRSRLLSFLRSDPQLSTAMAAFETTGPGTIKVATWNVAAINNNPFEYYTTLDDARYEQLMVDVGALIESPGDRDVPVSTVFTPAMFAKLQAAMAAQGWKGLDEVAARWEADYSKRTIIAGFLKDKDIGAKRLASMPDRFTNTINTDDGQIVCRPTVINNYASPMPDGEAWFAQWLAFFFETKLLIKDKSGAAAPTLPCTMLAPIKKAKYPAITDEEEAISVPLQLLCCAIFDATLVHVLNTLAPGAWHELKMSICEALVTTKSERTLKVLEGDAYADADVICLQECSCAFARVLRASPRISERFVVLEPAHADAVRDQNSILLVAKPKLAGEPDAALAELVPEPAALAGAPVADGDLCVFRAALDLGAGAPTTVLLASFHGDTNGLASTPVVSAVRALAPGLPIIFGLDANTHLEPDPKGARKFVGEFVAECAAGDAPLAHSWEGPPEGWRPRQCAHVLQPQLNKAAGHAERATSKRPTTTRRTSSSSRAARSRASARARATTRAARSSSRAWTSRRRLPERPRRRLARLRVLMLFETGRARAARRAQSPGTGVGGLGGPRAAEERPTLFLLLRTPRTRRMWGTRAPFPPAPEGRAWRLRAHVRVIRIGSYGVSPSPRRRGREVVVVVVVVVDERVHRGVEVAAALLEAHEVAQLSYRKPSGTGASSTPRRRAERLGADLGVHLAHEQRVERAAHAGRRARERVPRELAQRASLASSDGARLATARAQSASVSVGAAQPPPNAAGAVGALALEQQLGERRARPAAEHAEEPRGSACRGSRRPRRARRRRPRAARARAAARAERRRADDVRRDELEERLVQHDAEHVGERARRDERLHEHVVGRARAGQRASRRATRGPARRAARRPCAPRGARARRSAPTGGRRARARPRRRARRRPRGRAPRARRRRPRPRARPRAAAAARAAAAGCP